MTPPCTVGYRVHARVGADPEVVAALRELEVCTIADAARGFGVMDAGIGPVVPVNGTVAGPALTVAITPGNGAMLRKAITLAQPGDVMVVAGMGNRDRAVLGGSVQMSVAARGVAALIVDGAVRDLAELRAVGIPVLARGTTPRSGSDPHGAGEVNCPIACGGVPVLPGDLVVVDEDGVAVVGRADAEALIRRAHEVQAAKGSAADVARRMEAARQGHVPGLDGVEAAMRDAGAAESPEPWRPVPT